MKDDKNKAFWKNEIKILKDVLNANRSEKNEYPLDDYINKYLMMKRFKVYESAENATGEAIHAHRMIDSHIVTVIQNLPDKQLYSKLRSGGDFEILVPDIHVSPTYSIASFMAIVPKEKVEQIIFDV